MKKITNGYVLEVTEEVIDDHGDIDYRRETYTYYRPLKPENCIEKNGKLVSYRYGSDTLSVSSEKSKRTFHYSSAKSPYHSNEENERARIRKLEADGCLYEGPKLVYCDREAEGCVRPIKRFYMVENGAFKDCTKLEQVILPEGVEEIGHDAFSGCTNLKKIYIPSSITRIGIGAFDKCDSISEVVIAPGAKESYHCFGNTPFYKNKDNWEDGGLYVGETLAAYDGKFEGVAVIKKGTQSIARSAFYGCSISGVVFPESLKTIEYGAFSGCQNLIEIDLPKNITNIGERAFEGCSNLETVTIRSAIKVLAEYTFSGCKSLKNIQLPASLREIEGKCFRDCKSLETVVLPQKFQTIHPGSFDGCTLRSLTIPESARNIAPPLSSERYSRLETHTLGFAGMLIIRCKEGSYAEQYAKEYGIGYELV